MNPIGQIYGQILFAIVLITFPYEINTSIKSKYDMWDVDRCHARAQGFSLCGRVVLVGFRGGGGGRIRGVLSRSASNSTCDEP
jgi:hypothetical protein